MSPDRAWIDRLEDLAASSLAELSLRDLFPKQRQSVEFTLQHIQSQAIHSYQIRSSRQQAGDRAFGGPDFQKNPRWRARRIAAERPHNVLAIDGGRGSGKTTALLTVKRYLKQLRLSGWSRTDELDPANSDKAHALPDLDRLSNVNVSTALTYRVLTTSDLTNHERPMEALLAEIDDDLAYRRNAESDSDQKALLESLIDELRHEVQAGWIYAHQEGQKALLNDALDFKDFATQRSDLSIKAYQRIDAWHGFVDRLLSAVGAELLVAVFDDCDLHPEMSEHLLDDVRHYLAHPRIAAVLACDIGYLKRSMVRQKISATSLGAYALNLSEKPEASRYLSPQSLFNDAEKLSHALLEKTLPPNKRTSLSVPRRQDLETIVGPRPLTQIFAGQHAYLVVQSRVATSDGEQQSLLRCSLEWWFLTSSHSALVTQTVRRLIHFLNRAFPPRVNTTFPNSIERSLSDVLRRQILGPTSPIREGESISDAIMNNKMEPSWRMSPVRRGSPQVQGSAPDDREWERLCDFWIDVEIATRGLDTTSLVEISHWLPIPNPGLPAVNAQDRQRGEARFGVAAYYGFSVLPWSCLYVFQLRYLDKLIPELLATRYAYTAALPIKWQKDVSVDTAILVKTVTSPPAHHREIRVGIASVARSELPHYWPEIERPFAKFFRLFQMMGGQAGSAIDDWRGLEEKSSGSRQTLQTLFQDLRARGGDDDAPKFVQFCLALSELAERLEEQRHFYVAMWVMAVHLGVLGNDFSATQYRDSVERVSVDFSPPREEPQRNTRLEHLALTGLEIVSGPGRSLRTRVLHAWSLVPIAGRLLSIGDGHSDWERHISTFENVANILTTGSELLQARLKESSETSFESALRRLVPIDDKLNSPEKVFSEPSEELRWNFPDMDRAKLATMCTEMTDAAQTLRSELDRMKASVIRTAGDKALEEIRSMFGVSLPAALQLLAVANSALSQEPEPVSRKRGRR